MSDLIDRQAAIDTVLTMFDRCDGDINDYRDLLVESFKVLPSQERKTGRWIDMDDHVMCSCCGATHYGADKNYCPNCGCSMMEGE